ncbi:MULTISPECIES: hypothetical protein [Dyella]|uniref:Rod shape-determining protein MreD n=2 Tax=Dyella TaxID=231454 RepID=A0A4R0YN20_9GAMM|nr:MULTISPECIES: hypothetical protein [Dyella]TBR37040.1 hypothetical protein EYV96_14195 [Dyella terrae]TCI07871.1 hypothetical protein EZM97_24675 [Dyella soli]
MKLTEHRSILLWVVLTAVMIATRFHHFGTALNLPDASMAVFFLGGLGLRRHLGFAWFMVLAVVLDWISVSLAGVSDFCVTPAYSFLLLAYAVLWYAGRAYAGLLKPTVASVAGALGVGLVAASVSFAISNGSFYWLGGRYPDPHFTEYVSRLWKWGPLFVRTTMTYLAVALIGYGLVARWFANREQTEGARR